MRGQQLLISDWTIWIVLSIDNNIIYTVEPWGQLFCKGGVLISGVVMYIFLSSWEHAKCPD